MPDASASLHRLARPLWRSRRGEGPARSHPKHLNLAAAQKLSAEAFEKLETAQKANEYDMDGHAAKAKDLLEQANAEIKQAAEAANENKAKKE